MDGEKDLIVWAYDHAVSLVLADRLELSSIPEFVRLTLQDVASWVSDKEPTA